MFEKSHHAGGVYSAVLTQFPEDLLLLLLFLTFSVLVVNPRELLYTVANPTRGQLNRGNRTKKEVLQSPPPPPATRREEIQ